MTRALGVYIFAGGFTAGARQHAEVVAHLEDKPYFGTEVCQDNFPDVPIYFRSKDQWNDAIERFMGVDVVFANPPCAIFSPLGVSQTRGRDAWRTDPRSHCWVRSIEVALRVKCKIGIIESVPQALTRGREMIDALARAVMQRGYSVTYLLHNAAYTGICQRRKRFFFVMHKGTFGPEPLNWAPPPTVGEVLDGVVPEGEWIKLDPKYHDAYHGVKLRKNGSYESLRSAWCRQNGIDIRASNGTGAPMYMLHRLKPDIAVGAFTGNYWLHPTEPRHLAPSEMVAICGYPAGYKLNCRKSVVATCLAQAVMPSVGRWIMSSANRSLALSTSMPEPRLREFDWREPPGIGPNDITDSLANVEPHPLGALDG